MWQNSKVIHMGNVFIHFLCCSISWQRIKAAHKQSDSETECLNGLSNLHDSNYIYLDFIVNVVKNLVYSRLSVTICLYYLLIFYLPPTAAYSDDILSSLGNFPGHMKPFGSKKTNKYVETINGFPDSMTFFTNYVYKSKPVKMAGAAKISEAFNLWNDDYFLALDVPADNLVHVETKKKENRRQKTLEMHFKDFLRSYNLTENYMVQTIPDFLG